MERAAVPTSILIGGDFSPRTPGIYSGLIDAAGGDAARICVYDVAAAGPGAGRVYVEDLRRLGVERVRRVPVHGSDARAEARDPRIAALAERCSGHLFSGGNQLRAMRALAPGGHAGAVLRAVRSSASSGAVVAGSSAGLHVQSDPMIGGGDPRDALLWGATRRHSGRGVRLARGIGTFDYLGDSHFDQRGRLARMLVAASAAGSQLAFGVDEDTALVAAGPVARVVGSGGVTVLGREGSRWSFSYLRAGDRVSLVDGTVSADPSRSPVQPGPDGADRAARGPGPRRLTAPGISQHLAADLVRRGEAEGRLETAGSRFVVRLDGGHLYAGRGGAPDLTVDRATLAFSRAVDAQGRGARRGPVTGP